MQLVGGLVSFRMGPHSLTDFTGRDRGLTSHVRGTKKISLEDTHNQ